MSDVHVGDRVRAIDSASMRQAGLADRVGTVVSVGPVAVRVDIDGKTGTRTLFHDEVEKVTK